MRGLKGGLYTRLLFRGLHGFWGRMFGEADEDLVGVWKGVDGW